MTPIRELADRLEGLEKAATPGEWVAVDEGSEDEPMMSVKAIRIAGRQPTHCVAICATGDSPQWMENGNAAFIPTLRNAAPQIVKALRRLDAIERAMDEFANERITQRITLRADEIEKGNGK